MKVYVFLQLSLLHCILFDHSLENKMLKHFVLVLVAGCKILSAFWTLNILVMSSASTTYPTRANTLVDATHTNTHKQTNTHKHTHTNKLTQTHKNTNTYTHTHTHTHKHTSTTQTHTQTHTHTIIHNHTPHTH